jgi:protein-glutamine gamma-glutamyltransferase
MPAEEGGLIARIAEELQLGAMEPEEAVRAVTAFFANHFGYTTYQSQEHRPGQNRTALERFLTTARSGHCEHFATATVLLLRQAGIPARYAVGYSVQEGNGRKFVVRDRHAHAWTLAYLDGAWRDIDTTPASWSEIEQQGASWREAFADFRSRLWFEFQRFRWDKASTQLLIWLPVPLLLWFGGRLYWKRSWRRANATGRAGLDPRATPGWDSDFFKIERKLRARGFDREPGETTRQWVQRLEPQLNGSSANLRELLALHYQYRFDPMGLTASHRQALHEKAVAWLKTGSRLPRRP